MKLIFSLGNPEIRYSNTRHNIGFWLADQYCNEHSLSWIEKPKFRALLAEHGSGDEKVIVAKPTTYYNTVGESFHALADFYSISSANCLVIADDLALPFGTIRTRIGGSDAGNNGIKSINAHGGTNAHRLRIGIWNELRSRINDADFVLSRFSKLESTTLEENRHVLLSLVTNFINDSFEVSTYKLLPETQEKP